MIPDTDIEKFAQLNENNIQRFLAYKLVGDVQDREDIRQEFLMTLIEQPQALTKSGSYLTSILEREKIHYYRQQAHSWADGPMWPSYDDQQPAGWDNGPCLTDSTASIDQAININDFQSFLEKEKIARQSGRGHGIGLDNALACFFRLKDGKDPDKLLYKSFQKYRNLYQSKEDSEHD